MPFSAQKLFPLKYSVLWKLSFEHFFVESALFDILSAHDVMHCLYASMLSSSRSDMSIMSRNFGTSFLYFSSILSNTLGVNPHLG